MTAYYNENDKFAAAWLRELIDADLIAKGIVDERSIEDVTPGDLKSFTQCHFFAGIGVWSYALRLAGWSDDRPVWTGSCPCQPFSAAGKGAGFADERHLWPSFYWLISQCRPLVIFGEQVASPHGLAWLDLVQDDLESAGYAVGASDICAAGVGAPHIRQRLYWMADAQSCTGRLSIFSRKSQENSIEPKWYGSTNGLADTQSERIYRKHSNSECQENATGTQVSNAKYRQLSTADDLWLDNTINKRPQGRRRNDKSKDKQKRQNSDTSGHFRPTITTGGSFPTNGFWGSADWIYCTDQKWRPVESESFPLVNGSPGRVGRLRGYGNAIVAPLAKEFIKAYLEIVDM